MSSDDWRKPYRTMDAGGDPDAAVPVAWRWIEEKGEELKAIYPVEELEIVNSSDGDVGVIALYHRTELRYVATIFRDTMNFAVLVRWSAE